MCTKELCQVFQQFIYIKVDGAQLLQIQKPLHLLSRGEQRAACIIDDIKACLNYLQIGHPVDGDGRLIQHWTSEAKQCQLLQMSCRDI